MCRFAKRCENFYPDSDSTNNCLLLCQKNPLALAIALMPDRYIEKDLQVADPNRKKVEMTKTLPPSQSKSEKMQDEYNNMVSATQELDNEVVDFDPTVDIDKKLQAPSSDITDLIKRTNENRTSTKMDSEVTQAIEDNITDEGEPHSPHPLDDVSFEAVERIAIADQPDTPNNPKIYVKTRERGRPKMTEEEKEASRIRRKKEKEIEEERKQEEAIRKHNAMKKRVAKRKKERDEAKANKK